MTINPQVWHGWVVASRFISKQRPYAVRMPALADNETHERI
ncbi:hypothetical protein BIFANG_02391 [Bifidobacterium angulatum DSM 20098 = JCM 7096]|uniref:Uncharacterized protein n=1 Tax=Bifidobacterium angulatum DSM 20098 = JCM 7096 TaxID=518635 RepID=C4FDK5_9BIFI|nr:hypothetical protein BIFANG_02391 [Bifidobacterium angulatum DSM 20098 = JCM 7096]